MIHFGKGKKGYCFSTCLAISTKHVSVALELNRISGTLMPMHAALRILIVLLFQLKNN